jgi:hypothetical protein
MRLFIPFILFGSILFGQDLNLLRKNLELAPSNKTVCEQMIQSIPQTTTKPIYLAYLGAYQTIWANHVINPFGKLSTFNKGKKNLQKAVAMDDDNIEIRFLRYSIQKNAPKFLGYSSDLSSDKKFIESHLDEVNSAELKKMINSTL